MDIYKQARRLLHEEMLALGKGDLPRLLELWEMKRIWLQELASQPGQPDKQAVLSLWRQNRQILRACSQALPSVTGYPRRGRP